jgi:hypothetical protein
MMGRSSEETKLSKAIRERLKVDGVAHERVQCGIVPMRHGGFMHLATPGTPDLWTSLGWIEVKDKTELSQEQLAWHAKARYHNVRVTVARSADEAIAAIENWKRLDKENQMTFEQDYATEIQHTAKRLQETRANLVNSDVWREYLDASTALNDAIGLDALQVDCSRVDDAPIGLTLTEPDATIVAPTEPSQKYDDAAVDAIVRGALSGIETVESALTILKLAKDCELDSKTIGKSLKRIGAQTNGGTKRGMRYYLPVEATDVGE